MPYLTAVNDVFRKRSIEKQDPVVSKCVSHIKYTTVLKRRDRPRKIMIISSNSSGKVPKLV